MMSKNEISDLELAQKSCNKRMASNIKAFIKALLFMIAVANPQITTAKLILSNTLGSQANIEHSQVGLNGTFVGGTFVPGRTAGTSAYHSIGGTQYITFPYQVIPGFQGSIEFWGKIETNSDSLPWNGHGAGYWLEINDSITGYRMGFSGNNGTGGGGLCSEIPYGSSCSGNYGSWTYTQALKGGNVQMWHLYQLVWNKAGIPGFAGDTHKVAIFIDGQLQTGFGYNTFLGLLLTGGKLSIPGYPSHLFAGRSISIQDLKIYDNSSPPRP